MVSPIHLVGEAPKDLTQAVEARGPSSCCLQGWFLLRAVREGSDPGPSLSSAWRQPLLPVLLHPISSVALSVSVSNSALLFSLHFFLIKKQSQWIRTNASDLVVTWLLLCEVHMSKYGHCLGELGTRTSAWILERHNDDTRELGPRSHFVS